MNQQEAIAHFTDATNECLADAAQRWPEIAEALARTEIKFNIRAGQLLGQARFRRAENATLIRYNLAAAVMNPEKFADTVPHEVAHIVCFLRNRGKGHDIFWINACNDLGGDGKRCSTGNHYPELKSRASGARGTRYYRWTGAAGAQWVTKKRHLGLTSNEWMRVYFKLDTCTENRVMSKDEWRAAEDADRAARAKALKELEDRLAAAQEVLAILKRAA